MGKTILAASAALVAVLAGCSGEPVTFAGSEPQGETFLPIVGTFRLPDGTAAVGAEVELAADDPDDRRTRRPSWVVWEGVVPENGVLVMAVPVTADAARVAAANGGAFNVFVDAILHCPPDSAAPTCVDEDPGNDIAFGTWATTTWRAGGEDAPEPFTIVLSGPDDPTAGSETEIDAPREMTSPFPHPTESPAGS